MLWLFISVKGIPYNVTVFATNGRGSGRNVSKISYAEEDGKNYHHYAFLSNTIIIFSIPQFHDLQGV